MSSVDEAQDVVVESGRPLSESVVWRLQKDFYINSGINAWVDQIPLEVTSNPFIGNSYAHIAVAYIRDNIAKNPSAANYPFYFLEMGFGSGKFSFYMIKSILHLLELTGMQHIQIKYIMSDIADNNIAFSEAHPRLRRYIDAGIIDFAIFELESDQPIHLRYADIEISRDVLINPIIVVANYVFDSATHDAFRIIDHRAQRLLVDLYTKKSNLKDGEVVSMQELQVKLTPSTDGGYRYEDDNINYILDAYRDGIKNSNVLIPVGALKALTYLNRLANNRMLLMSTDKGHHSLQSLDNLGAPGIVFHASSCFSMMVNFHALGVYFKKNNGDAHLEISRDLVLETAVYVSGATFNALPETNIAIQQYIDEISPCDYYKLCKSIIESAGQSELDAIATHLSLSHWDPTLFCNLWDRISALLTTASSNVIEFLATQLPKVADNYYYLPTNDRVLLNIGLFYHHIGKYGEAIKYYQEALLHDSHYPYYLHHNLGLCFMQKADNKSALSHFELALAIDPDAKDTAEMISKITK